MRKKGWDVNQAACALHCAYTSLHGNRKFLQQKTSIRGENSFYGREILAQQGPVSPELVTGLTLCTPKVFNSHRRFFL